MHFRKLRGKREIYGVEPFPLLGHQLIQKNWHGNNIENAFAGKIKNFQPTTITTKGKIDIGQNDFGQKRRIEM
jgi:hypothetical protein